MPYVLRICASYTRVFRVVLFHHDAAKRSPVTIMHNLILRTAATFAILGYVFSSRELIRFLNTLNPFQGLLFYYFQLFVVLEVLQYFGLIIGGVKMQSLSQTIGELLLIFAFFIIVDQESEWVAYVTGEAEGKKKDYPVIYTQAEDGAVYYLWSTYVTSNPETARLLTFVFTPAVLVTVGLYLTGGKSVRRELLA